MIKGIIFDMDGVLINSEDLYIEFEYKFFNNLGASVTTEYLESFKGTSTRNLIADVYNKYKVTSIPQEEALKLLNNAGKLIYTNPKLRLINGVTYFLDYFKEKNMPMVIGSSSFTKSIESVIDRFSLDKYFNGYISGEMVKNTKPDPEIFIRSAELLELEPNECMVIEDSFNGIKAAKAAGCMCTGYLNEGKSIQDMSLCDLVIDIFSEDRVTMLDRFINYHNIKVVSK